MGHNWGQERLQLPHLRRAGVYTRQPGDGSSAKKLRHSLVLASTSFGKMGLPLSLTKDLWLFLSFDADDSSRQHTVGYHFLSPASELLARWGDTVTMRDGYTVALSIGELRVRHEGTHHFDVAVDGRSVTRISCDVVLSPRMAAAG